MDSLTAIPDAKPTDPRGAVMNKIYDLLRIVAAATAVILTVWLLSDVLTVVFASALLAVILHGMSNVLRRFTGLPYWAALAIMTVTVLALLVGLGFLAGPGLADQASKLKEALTTQAQGLHGRLGQSHTRSQ
jgi:predicted PurR-regulated permease PerM